jgi:hypothetical protein
VAYTLARGALVIEYTPTEWIGGVAKAVLHQRIWAALRIDERDVVSDYPDHATVLRALQTNLKRLATGKPPLHHDWFNVLDAVGVGLFHTGRVGTGAAPVRRVG